MKTKRALRFYIAALLLGAILCVSAAPAAFAAPGDIPDSREESYFAHFCGHFNRAVGAIGVDAAFDAASCLLEEEPATLWKKITSLTLAGVNIPELLAGGLSWNTGATLLYALWQVLPKDKFKHLAREVMRCPRCRAAAWNASLGLGQAAWRGTKAGGAYVGEMMGGAWDSVRDGSAAAWSWTREHGASAGRTSAAWSARVWNSAKNGCAYAGEKTAAAWRSLCSGTASAWKMMWSGAKSWRWSFSLPWNHERGFWASAWDGTRQWSRRAWQSTKDGCVHLGRKSVSLWNAVWD